VTELFDTSCIHAMAHHNFTTFMSKLWEEAPPEITAKDLIAASGLNPYALGQHYFVPDPNNATDGTLYAKWDFTSTAMKHDPNRKNAYAVGYRTGEVTSPDDPSRDADWLSLAPVIVNGKPDGQLADQVFRLNSNGGSAPASVCLFSLRLC
jgi:hypothetical protein